MLNLLNKNELKEIYYNRKKLRNFFTRFDKSILYVLFIDDFDIYRNIYRALKKINLIFAYLLYKKRKKFVNIFISILNSHEIKLNNMIKIFVEFIQKLNCEMKLKINNNIKSIYVFIITFLKNISQ